MCNEMFLGLLILNCVVFLYSVALTSIKERGDEGVFDGSPDWIRLRNVPQNVDKLRKFLEVPDRVLFVSILFWILVCIYNDFFK